MPDVSAFVDEVASELNMWPGVRIEGARTVPPCAHEQLELGVLTETAASPSCPSSVPSTTSSSSTATPRRPRPLPIPTGSATTCTTFGRGRRAELFDRRYRDVRGEGNPYSSEDLEFKSPG